jgi:C4-dicarboxylate transporter DctM subunit
MIPAMAERGYDRAYATALVVSAGVLAPLVPPSIAFVIWGVIAEQSISKLFLSGVVPGMLMAIGMVVLIVVKALREKAQREPRAGWRERLAALREGVWALLAPLVVLGGIYGGAFTPTEAAVAACVYALLVGVVIERRLHWRDLPGIVSRAMSISGVVMAVVAVSSGFGFLVAQEQLATKLALWLSTQFESRWSMLLALNLGFFAMAAVMDEIAIMVILGPMLISIANQFGVDPIHFGAMIVTNVAIGMATPPIGYCLFVGMAIGGVGLWPLSRAIAPFILMMLAVLMLVTYVPSVALLLIQ